jgi:hypothetical protein
VTNNGANPPSSPPRLPLTNEERTWNLLDRLGEPEDCHLELDTDIIPFLGGTLDATGREIVESHLDDCATCRAEVNDLRGAVLTRAPRRWVPLAIAASLAIVATIVLLSRDRGPVAQPVTTTAAVATQTAAIETQSPPRDPLVEKALETGELPFPAWMDDLRRTPGALRGAALSAPAAFSPEGIVVTSTRPLFRWPASRDATYTVFVFEGEREVASSGPLTRAEWTPPRSLERGRTYAWQVETKRGEETDVAPKQTPAKFRVADARAIEAFDEARAAAPADALLLAVLAARAGLADEAARQLARADASKDPRVKKLVERYDASPSRTNAAQ